MTRKILFVLLSVAACSKSGGGAGGGDTAKCEAARDKYLKNYDEMLTALLAEDNDTQKANDAKAAETEKANATKRFVAACKTTADFKYDCFDSLEKEKSADCKKFVRDFEHQIVRDGL